MDSRERVAADIEACDAVRRLRICRLEGRARARVRAAASMTPIDARGRLLRFLVCVVAVSTSLLACGGGSDGAVTQPPPPPTPVVTAVEVTPATATVNAGDQVQLAVVVKDQNGATMSGQSVAWSSSSTAIATVSASGAVSAVAAGTATITATVASKSGSSTVTVAALPRLALDAGGAVSQTISPNGGVITQARNGVSYELSIPAGALVTPTRITMTPVSANRQLPASGTFVAGMRFEPTGTTFLKPLTLKVITHVTVPTGQSVVGYMANDTGAVTALEVGTRTGDTLTLSVRHFSVGGWGTFVPSILQTVPILSDSTTDGFRSQLAALDANSSATASDYATLYTAWYALVDAELHGAQQLKDFDGAAGDFLDWDERVAASDQQFHFQPTLASRLTSQRSAGVTILPSVLQTAIGGHNLACGNSFPTTSAAPLAEAQVVFALQDMAQHFGIATSGNQLDAATVANALCIKVINTIANFPNNPTPNQAAQLDLRYGVQRLQDPQLLNVLFKVTLIIAGTTNDGTQVLQTNAAGELSGNVVPTGQTALNIFIRSCVHPDLGYRLDEVCTTHQVNRSFGITITGSVTVLTQTGLQSLSNAAKVTGDLTILSSAADPVTSTDLRELSQLTDVGGTLTISGVQSLTSVSGLHGLSSIGRSLVLSGDSHLTDLAGLAQVTRVPAQLQLNGLQALSDLSGISAITRVGSLNLSNDAALTTLLPLSGMAIDSSLTVQGTGLVTLTHLPKLPALLPGGVLISQNAALKDVAPFSTVTDVTNDVFVLDNPAMTDLVDMASLRTVGRALQVRGMPLTTLAALTGVRHVGTVFTLNVDGMQLTGPVSFGNLTDVGSSGGTGAGLSVFASAGGGCAGSVALSFPALTLSPTLRVSTNVGQGGSCRVSVSLPSLTVGTGGLLLNSDALTTFVVNGVQGSATIFGEHVTSVALGTLDVGGFTLSGACALSTLPSATGAIRGRATITNNPLISDAAATAYAQAHGATNLLINNNGNPAIACP